MSGLTVYLNRDGLNTVEADQTTVRATESVEIALENHGKPTHVHLHLDDELATLGTVEDSHWFVPKDEWRAVDLAFMAGAEGSGRLEITAGYGQERESVYFEVETATEAETPASDRIDTVGGSASEEPEVGDAEPVEPLTESLDLDRLRNPVVLTTGGAFLFVLVLLLFVNPVAALAAGVGASLVAVAVGSYVTEWDPFSMDSGES